jgi:hypothetical protein
MPDIWASKSLVPKQPRASALPPSWLCVVKPVLNAKWYCVVNSNYIAKKAAKFAVRFYQICQVSKVHEWFKILYITMLKHIVMCNSQDDHKNIETVGRLVS